MRRPTGTDAVYLGLVLRNVLLSEQAPERRKEFARNIARQETIVLTNARIERVAWKHLCFIPTELLLPQ
jgi:hypothetical protein